MGLPDSGFLVNDPRGYRIEVEGKGLKGTNNAGTLQVTVEWLQCSVNTCPYQSSAVSLLHCTFPLATNMSNFNDTFDARRKYTHFRILVIGRANAGKTTLLKRVCNTTEEPCTYDEKNNNLVRLLPICCTNPTANRYNRSIQLQR